MLDERKEYEEYTKPEKRLKYSTLINTSNGKTTLGSMERPLTIIAREAWFNYKKTDKEQNKEKVVICKLRDWMMQTLSKYMKDELIEEKDDEVDESIDEIIKCFEKLDKAESDYHQSKYNKELKEEDKKKAKKEADKEKEKLAKKVTEAKEKANVNKTKNIIVVIGNIVKTSRKYYNESKSNDSNNTRLDITYERIISNAITKGDLKKYVLVCSSNNLKDIKKRSKEEIINKKDEDRILKVLAAYLLEKNSPRTLENIGGEYYYINYADITNWLKDDSKINNKKIKEYYCGEDKDNNLFLNLPGRVNFAKIKVNQDWLEKGGWEIIEEAELDDWKEKHNGEQWSCFFDQGACKPLLECSKAEETAEMTKE